MKLRLLKQLLNNTKYALTNQTTYLAIGSTLCHDLIKLDISTMKISYALDTWKKGRDSVNHHEELSFIWDKLQELIDSDEINPILLNDDVIENPITVYTYYQGAVLKKCTDALGYPNITHDGYLMHDDNYFTDEKLAIDYGIKEEEYYVKMINERLDANKMEELKLKSQLSVYESRLNLLEFLKLTSSN